MKTVIPFILLLVLPKIAFSFWSDFSLTSGSNEFTRIESNFASNISTKIVAGIGASSYKLENHNYVYALRFPVSVFVGRSTMLSAKPYFYPADSDGSFAQGLRASFSYLTENPQDETSSTYLISVSHQRQRLSSYGQKDFSSNCAEFSIEKNFYDQFFLLVSVGAMSHSAFSKTAQKNYAETQDIISLNTSAFLNDAVNSKLGLQFARSFKPDFDSYIYAGYEKINSRFSQYNSWLVGLRINFSEKNFANFSYNYLDSSIGRSKIYYRVGIGLFLK